MPKQISTQWYTIHFGWEHQTTFTNNDRYKTQEDELIRHLENLTTDLDRNQYLIKAVVPLTESAGNYSRSKNESWGYGISQIVGFVVLAQKEEELSEDEYLKRTRKNDLERNIVPMLRKKYEDMEQQIKDYTEKRCYSEGIHIVEEKSFLSGLTYKFGLLEFSGTTDGLKRAQEAVVQIKALPRELEETKAALVQAEQELKSLS
jgi:hypothetical protein